MHRFLRALALLAAIAAAFVLFGCGAVSQQQKAIENAIVAYSDYYIEVRDLGGQVRSQAQSADPNASVWEYTILADIPNYPELPAETVAFTPPAPDFSQQNAAQYEKACALALRQTLESYALDHTFETYVQLPLTFTLSESARGWLATLSNASRNEVENAVDSLVADVLHGSEAYLENSRLAAVADAKNTLLCANFGGADYAALASATNVTALGGNRYALDLSFPDPAALYAALDERYVSSFNQPFFGAEKTVSLDASDLSYIDTADMPLVSARVSAEFDESTASVTISDASALDALIAPAKAAAEADAAARVNAQWLVAAEEAPSSGAVLEGESKGNEIVFVTSDSLGKYYYVRFYKLTGEDVDEEGTLVAGMFIVGGKRASVRLPSGYYRISCAVGDAWYGLDYLFGTFAKTFDGGNAIESRSGYINTVSFG